MNAITKSIADGYVQQMDSYKVEDPELKQEVEEWKAAVYDLAEECGNPSKFTESMMQGPLFSQMTDLSYRITMAEYEASHEGQSIELPDPDGELAPLPTVKEFVDQYRFGYDAVKETKYRVKTVKAYEDIFAVADRTDDIIEAQIILEKEGLLRKMTATAGIEVGETVLEAMDPLYDVMRATTEEHVKAYEDFLCPEEVTYKGELIAEKAAQRVNKGYVFIWLGTIWGLLTMEYQIGKQKLRSWKNDIDAKGGFQLMVTRRQKMRQLYRVMEEVLGISWEELMANEFIKNWMLSPAGVDQFWRCKHTLLPENFVAIEEIVKEEVMTDLTIPQILQREQKALIVLALRGGKADEAKNNFERMAKEKNSTIEYYRYMERLSEQEKKEMMAQATGGTEKSSYQTSSFDTKSSIGDMLSSGDSPAGTAVGAISKGLGKLFRKK